MLSLLWAKKDKKQQQIYEMLRRGGELEPLLWRFFMFRGKNVGVLLDYYFPTEIFHDKAREYAGCFLARVKATNVY